jgi:hypothetical protein
MVMSFTAMVRLLSLMTLLLFGGCSPKYANKVPKLGPRLQELFAKTKLLCFGRYAIEVPQEAKIEWGNSSFPSRIEVIGGGLEAIQRQVVEDVKKLKRKDRTSEITYNGEGPIERSWQIRYYEGEIGKEMGLHYFKTYLNKGEITFILRGSVDEKETEEAAAARQKLRAINLRLREPDDVPSEPGYCIEHAFMSNNQYSDQEMVSAGIYLPSLPDVSFSISSNKDAYGDYPPEQFEKTQRAKLSLLNRIKQAQEDQGIFYPSRNVLREGKRDVQHWHGEESLIKRKDGTHDFEWALVGKPMDVANPSEFGAQMYKKVENNTVGAAKVASLSDDEAVALWDRLLSGLKFRVKVPGAPPGSYYFPQAKQQEGETK